ncbi:hypothetical protein TI03_00930 [Achromatium sp. WMS1]|nr:hypothetical protein TI03_00930 [Achromatium sp. WMS1]
MIQRLILITLLGLAVPAWGENTQLADAMAQGQWITVEKLLANRRDTVGLLMRGEARRVLGHLDTAYKDHETAWQQAETSELKIWAGRTSAETLLAMHKYTAAKERLKAIPEGCNVAECAKLALVKGRLYTALEYFDEALVTYEQARNYARTADLRTLSVKSQLGIMEIEPGTEETIETLIQELQQVTPVYAQTTLQLALAKHAYSQGYLNLTQQLLNQAAPHVALGQQRAEFWALQTSLLEDTEQYQKALQTVGKAIREARRIGSENLLMHGEWQRGRLYHALDDTKRALAAFRRALFYLERIRADIPINYRNGHSSFRETLSPLYLETTDLLLKEATKTSEEEEDTAQLLLIEARNVIERLKAAELQDYLGEICPLDIGSIANLEAIAPRTGVLYPIILPNRLVLLLGIGNRQYQKTVAVEAEALNIVAKDLGSQLRAKPPNDDSPILPPKTIANQLFNWLIAPIQDQLEAANIQTLVIIPDGSLRLFPFAALMDGDKFLVERYAIVTAPSLTLMAPQPLARGNVNALVAGMSRPGPVVDEFAKMQHAINGQGSIQNFLIDNKKRSRRLRGLKLRQYPQAKKRATDTTNTTTFRLSPVDRQAMVEQLALPGVEQEVAQIARTFGSDAMLNQNFTRANFSQSLIKNSWRIVHVATHGFFGGTVETSFFMTYDHLLKANQLDSIISGKVDSDPPELLTLSACQTAEGNDRAPLGIIGIAVQSGARSALGSLWPVSDDATQLLISEFYHNLLNSNLTKAQAFQKAQLTVLQRKEFHHPFFWSPFILIGNWL